MSTKLPINPINNVDKTTYCDDNRFALANANCGEDLGNKGTMCPIPPGTPCFESLRTRKHILFLNETISLIREYYMNVNA